MIVAQEHLALQHLSEEDLDDLLLGSPSSAAAAHVAGCVSCRERADAFTAPLAAFNAASSAWSQARSHTISRDLRAHHSPLRVTPGGLWSSAAVLAVAILFGIRLNPASDAGSPDALVSNQGSNYQASTHQDHADTELASDNEMLSLIDSEMASPQPGRFGLYQPVRGAAAGRPVSNGEGSD